ncbi:cold-shock protein [Moritella dasanensis]|uniref:cold-shock protein n=1 Tax=Moritella dasanensis TaxID=428031 RepID=UPI00030101BE|nr:hypothetical protein [Moritella dasanensis]
MFASSEKEYYQLMEQVKAKGGTCLTDLHDREKNRELDIKYGVETRGYDETRWFRVDSNTMARFNINSGKNADYNSYLVTEHKAVNFLHEDPLVKLKYGNVIKYSDRGFGFIKDTASSDILKNEYFFHISVVNKLGIESELINLTSDSNISFWFIVEKTEKGMAVSQAWTDANSIPVEYLVELAEQMAVKQPLQSSKSPTLNKLLENSKTNQEIKPNKIVTSQTFNIFDNPRFSDLRLKLDYRVTNEQIKEIKQYVRIYKTERYSKHHEVNTYITKNQVWGQFSNIRSMNDHGNSKTVPGILPKFYSIVCEILSISGDNGAPLLKSEAY